MVDKVVFIGRQQIDDQKGRTPFQWEITRVRPTNQPNWAYAKSYIAKVSIVYIAI